MGKKKNQKKKNQKRDNAHRKDKEILPEQEEEYEDEESIRSDAATVPSSDETIAAAAANDCDIAIEGCVIREDDAAAAAEREKNKGSSRRHRTTWAELEAWWSAECAPFTRIANSKLAEKQRASKRMEALWKKQMNWMRRLSARSSAACSSTSHTKPSSSTAQQPVKLCPIQAAFGRPLFSFPRPPVNPPPHLVVGQATSMRPPTTKAGSAKGKAAPVVLAPLNASIGPLVCRLREVTDGCAVPLRHIMSMKPSKSMEKYQAAAMKIHDELQVTMKDVLSEMAAPIEGNTHALLFNTKHYGKEVDDMLQNRKRRRSSCTRENTTSKTNGGGGRGKSTATVKEIEEDREKARRAGNVVQAALKVTSEYIKALKRERGEQEKEEEVQQQPKVQQVQQQEKVMVEEKEKEEDLEPLTEEEEQMMRRQGAESLLTAFDILQTEDDASYQEMREEMAADARNKGCATIAATARETYRLPRRFAKFTADEVRQLVEVWHTRQQSYLPSGRFSNINITRWRDRNRPATNTDHSRFFGTFMDGAEANLNPNIDELLHQLERQTHYTTKLNVPASGQPQGKDVNTLPLTVPAPPQQNNQAAYAAVPVNNSTVAGAGGGVPVAAPPPAAVAQLEETASRPLPNSPIPCPSTAPRAAPDYIRVHLYSADGLTTIVSLKTSTRMGKLKEKHSKRLGRPIRALVYRYKGKNLRDNDTVRELGMKENDIIHVLDAVGTRRH